MTPTPESLRRTADAIEAKEAGKPWQLRIIGMETWTDSSHNNSIGGLDSYEFRPKPTKKLRPWTFDEVPIGSVVIDRNRKIKKVITAVYEKSVAVGSNTDYTTSFEALLRDCLRPDGSPCGVEEEA